MRRCLLEVIAGHDPRDSTSLDVPVPAVHRDGQPAARRAADRLGQRAFCRGARCGSRSGGARGARRVRVARRDGARDFAAARQVRRGDVLRHRAQRGVEQPGPLRRRALRLSHRTSRKCWPSWRPSESSWKPPAISAGSTISIRRWCGCIAARGPKGFGPEVKRRIMLGTYALSAGYYDAYYLKALKVRRLIRQDFDQRVREGRSHRRPDHRRRRRSSSAKWSDDPLAMYLVDLYTVSANLAGIAGIVPAVRLQPKSGLPIGLQLQAPPFAGRAAAARRPHVSNRRPTGTQRRAPHAAIVSEAVTPPSSASKCTCSWPRRASCSAAAARGSAPSRTRRRARSASACRGRCR